MTIPRTAPPYRGTFRPRTMASHGMVVSGHPLASWWGTEILRRGGNAVDAGVAAGLVINVVHNDMASFSGVAPTITFVPGETSAHSVAGIGRWAKSLDTHDYAGLDALPKVARTVVPGAPDAWFQTLSKFGTFTWSELVEYPVRLARKGFPVHPFFRENVIDNLEEYQRYPENRRIYLVDDVVPPVGYQLRQKELGDLLASLDGGTKTVGVEAYRTLHSNFYKGDIAQQILSHYQREPCDLTTEDFSDYRATIEEGIHVNFAGATVWGTGPWSQGPVLLMALNILNHLPIAETKPGEAMFLHYILEALNLAFVDLEAHCGDPEFIDVPMQALLSSAYGEARASLVRKRQAFGEAAPFGDPKTLTPAAGVLPEVTGRLRTGRSEPDTSFVCAVDSSGMLFSATPSDGYSGNPIVPGLGIHVSSRGVQGRLERGRPNSIEAGKRPRLTPNPVVVTREGLPYMTLGTPGNNRQPQAMLQTFLYTHLFGYEPQAAVEAPRVASYNFPATSFPHVYKPGLVRAEAGVPEHVRDSLKDMGHTVETIADFSWALGGVCMIVRDGENLLHAGADPRRETYAVGF